VWGGAIRLDPEAPEIAIGEGIESSASAGRLLDLPAWAALSAGNMARGLILPPLVRAVVIAADADEAGQKAAEAAAARWRAEGRRVRIARPDKPGHDFNDILAERVEVPHAA
jgi:putative DNA primase/helicase